MPSDQTPTRYLDRKRLLNKVPLSYPSIWKRMKRGDFPLPRVLGGKNAWDEAEVDAWLTKLRRRDYAAND